MSFSNCTEPKKLILKISQKCANNIINNIQYLSILSEIEIEEMLIPYCNLQNIEVSPTIIHV